jgi:hypothetical protein
MQYEWSLFEVNWNTHGESTSYPLHSLVYLSHDRMYAIRSCFTILSWW